MLQVTRIQTRKQCGRSGIFKMAEAPRDAPFQLRRIVALRQHCGIVVAFQHKGIAAAQHSYDMGR